MLGSPSLNAVWRHHLRHFLQLLHHLQHGALLNKTLLNPFLGETLENLIPVRCQIWSLLETLVTSKISCCSPNLSELRSGWGRCCTRSCEANLTISPSLSHCSCNASSTARNDKAFLQATRRHAAHDANSSKKLESNMSEASVRGSLSKKERSVVATQWR